MLRIPSEVMPSGLVTVIEGCWVQVGLEPKILEVPDDEIAKKGRQGSLSSKLVGFFDTGNVSWAGPNEFYHQPCDEDLRC